jgi:rhodanese-related sulfurtransferase
VEYARERANAVARSWGVSFLDAEGLRSWRDEAGDRTLYLFDVRQPEEFEAGHLPGSRSAPGGQLVQALDEYAAVRNGRFVLLDDTEARAIMTAHWLMQMGLAHVRVLRGGLDGSGLGSKGLERGSGSAARIPVPPDLPVISATDLAAALKEVLPPLVVNVGSSNLHREGHIPGAAWVTRGRLEFAWRARPGSSSVVVVSDAEDHARFAAAEARRLWPQASVFVFGGGAPAWTRAGFSPERGMPWALCSEDDLWYRPYQDPAASSEAARGYFDWESGLVDHIIRDGSVRFRVLNSPEQNVKRSGR